MVESALHEAKLTISHRNRTTKVKALSILLNSDQDASLQKSKIRNPSYYTEILERKWLKQRQTDAIQQ